MKDPKELIKKLLALAESQNENEAALAAERAAALTIKHGIDLAQSSEYTDEGDFHSTKNERWVGVIAWGIAHLNACHTYYDHSTHCFRFIGRPSSTQTCNLMLTYLVDTVKRIGNENIRKYGYGQTDRSAYRKAFRSSAASRLQARMKTKRKEMETHGIQPFSDDDDSRGTRALVVLKYYEQEELNINAFIDLRNLNLKQRKSVPITMKSVAGIVDGAKAGDSIGLDQQLAPKNQLMLTGE